MSRDSTSEQNANDEEPLGYDEWRKLLLEGSLLGLECSSCGHVTGTPKRACLECGNRGLRRRELPETGVVHSETTINVPPEGFDERSYQVAVIDLGPARVMARIDGTAGIGDRVALSGVTRTTTGPAPSFAPTD